MSAGCLSLPGSVTASAPRAQAPRPFLYAAVARRLLHVLDVLWQCRLAATKGYDFVPVYLGPILAFALGWPFIRHVVRVAKRQNITSVADFLAARYGRSQGLSATVTLIAVVATLPYIALQLKAIVLVQRAGV